jgi:SseB protein N-terminal domain
VTAYALPPVSQFAGDDGSADPALAAVLIAFGSGQVGLHAVQRALVSARVLVPVVAELGELGGAPDARPVQKTAHMSSVTIAGRDGRLAQPMFTSIDALRAWNALARPFPSTAVDVARGAYAGGAVAVIVDVAGPIDVVLEGPAMLALAECRAWLPAAEDPEVLAAVGEALSGLPGLAGVDVSASAEADLTLTLHVLGACSSPESARAVAQEAAQRLAAVDLLRFRLERGLDLAVTPT